MGLKLNVQNETSTLDTVILGIGELPSGPSYNNPKSLFYLEQDTYPVQKAILHEINQFQNILIENGVKVLRPKCKENLIQIFARDIGFVIGDTFIKSSMIASRKPEIDCIDYILDYIDSSCSIIDASDKKYGDAKIEGGDVMLNNDTVFIGKSNRTNDKGFELIKDLFGSTKKVVQIEVNVDSLDYKKHVLHLDCTFQPIGTNHAIIYEDGIKNINDLYKHLSIPAQNIFVVNKPQFLRMFPNILSLSEKKVVIEKEFIELKYWLLDKGFHPIEVEYKEISKLSGLLRCSTLPLVRIP